jgi:hypothetical protein
MDVTVTDGNFCFGRHCFDLCVVWADRQRLLLFFFVAPTKGSKYISTLRALLGQVGYVLQQGSSEYRIQKMKGLLDGGCVS